MQIFIEKNSKNFHYTLLYIGENIAFSHFFLKINKKNAAGACRGMAAEQCGKSVQASGTLIL